MRSLAEHGIPYFPAFLDLAAKRVLVVGGGTIATNKVQQLLPCRPEPLVVVAPIASVTIQTAAANHRLTWCNRPYEPADCAGAALVFAATDDRALNAAVAADARRLGIAVLAVDDVPNCDFIAPAIVRRGDVVIAISTGGRSPAIARRTREYLDRRLPAYWGDLLDVAANARQQLGATRALIDPERWQTALDGEVELLTQDGDLEQATALLLNRLERSLFETPLGLVSLVGAGPGDPELLTLRAVRRLQSADAVVHDRLVTPEVLAFVPEHAERFDVGKTPHHAGPTQDEIHALLIRLGRAGRRVVRLKGGDPFVFGRGGEEALALAEAGIPFEIVPGISAALAAPAAAGIPVTHRGLSSSVTILTGHGIEHDSHSVDHDGHGVEHNGRAVEHDGRRVEHDWPALARARGTLVFLMAVENLEQIVSRLLAHGRPADEPAALVRWASTPRQEVITAPLHAIVEAARAANLQPPAVLVVGPTAALSSHLTRTATPVDSSVAIDVEPSRHLASARPEQVAIGVARG